MSATALLGRSSLHAQRVEVSLAHVVLELLGLQDMPAHEDLNREQLVPHASRVPLLRRLAEKHVEDLRRRHHPLRSFHLGCHRRYLVLVDLDFVFVSNLRVQRHLLAHLHLYIYLYLYLSLCMSIY